MASNAPGTTETNNDPNLSIPAISLPKGGGSIRTIDEKMSVNAVNGTAVDAADDLASDLASHGSGLAGKLAEALGRDSGEVAPGIFRLTTENAEKRVFTYYEKPSFGLGWARRYAERRLEDVYDGVPGIDLAVGEGGRAYLQRGYTFVDKFAQKELKELYKRHEAGYLGLPFPGARQYLYTNFHSYRVFEEFLVHAQATGRWFSGVKYRDWAWKSMKLSTFWVIVEPVGILGGSGLLGGGLYKLHKYYQSQ